MDQLIGVLSSLTVFNDRWGRGFLRCDDNTYHACVGTAIAGLIEGNRYCLSGQHVTHDRYGRQFDVAAATIDIPCNEEALVRHLRLNFKGCGKATAQKLVDQYRNNLPALRDLLISNPSAVDFSAVTKREIHAEEDPRVSRRIYRQMSASLGVAGVRDSILRKLADFYAPTVETAPDPVALAWQVFTENPYAPIAAIKGYGFAAADEIAKVLGFDRHHPFRLSALANHALAEGCDQNGHVFLTLDEITRHIKTIDETVSAQAAIDSALQAEEPIVIEDGRYYPAYLYKHERQVAAHLAARLSELIPPITELHPSILAHEIGMAESSLGPTFKLDDTQRRALRGILTSACSIHTLTAGPGCGKTALMEILVHVVRHKRILFCAPTGKAAKVLSSRIVRYGKSASTIHAMLEVTLEGFHFNAENPLQADIIVVDESSMLDLALARALLDATLRGAHIIFLGDIGQLPSVGPGQFLANLLELPFDHHRLSITHRNDGGILEVVRLAGAGFVDCTDRPDVTFTHGLPPAEGEGLRQVVDTYVDAAGRCGIDRVGLLVARRKGDINTPGWNVTYLNENLRNRLNPGGTKIVGTSLRAGDRIIIRANQLLKQEEDESGKARFEQVVNGDTGFIRTCVTDAQGTSVAQLILDLDDGREIRYPGSELEALGLAYALTVHAAQGSEYEEEIFVCINGSPNFINRGITYTAFSRAKKRLTIVGDDDVIKAVCRRPVPRRNSTLVDRTRNYATTAITA